MSKTEAISQKLQKQPKMSKNGHFWVIKAKKIPVFEFLQEYQYSNTLEDTNNNIFLTQYNTNARWAAQPVGRS